MKKISGLFTRSALAAGLLIGGAATASAFTVQQDSNAADRAAEAREITTLFGKFAGRVITVKETTSKFDGNTYVEPEILPGDATVRDMDKVAADHGLTVRFILPGYMYSEIYDRNRVDVIVNKGNDGKYRVAPTFERH